MRRRLRRPVTADAGFTLTELLVSIGIFSVISAMVTSAAVTGLHQQTQVANRDDALAQLRAALQRIDRDIRSADPLLTASPTRLVLRKVEATTTKTVTIEVSGASLVSSETRVSSSGETTTIPPHTLLTNLVATAGPVFSFTPITGYTAPSGSGVNPTNCTLGAGFDAGCVGTITVRVTVRPPYLSADISMSDNGTQLRNAA